MTETAKCKTVAEVPSLIVSERVIFYANLAGGLTKCSN